MIYRLRRRDGSIEPNPPGTLIGPDGRASGLKAGDVEIQVLDTWRSPRSRGRYPSRWRITLPAAGIELDVAPLVADQELDTAASTGIIYWEGVVAGRGRAPRGELTCEGYIELTGYAGSLGRIF
jgi:predicted secreted hydrolase